MSTELKREIGVRGLTSNIVNTIIGAGIFVIPAIVAAGLGSASILAYLICSIMITLTMLCVAEVGSKITDTGGVYVYIERTFGKYPGFLAAVLMLLATLSADAAIANAIVQILFKIFPFAEGNIVRIVFFLTLFSGLGYINVRGLKKGIGLVKLITMLKIVPLLLLVLVGVMDIDPVNLYWEAFPSFDQIGTTSLILYFAYTGAGAALSVSGEVRNPQKTIPRSIFLAIVIISIIYVLIQTVAQGVLGSELATFTENPLGELAGHIIGPIGFTLLTVGAAVSMFGSLSSKVLSVPRILFAASKDEVIPIKGLSFVHNKYATPYISIIVYTALCFVFAALGGFKQLAIISSASSLIISFGIVAAVIKLRMREDTNTDSEGFRIPGGYTVPILASFVVVWLLSHLALNAIMSLGIFVVILTVLYVLMRSDLIKRLIKGMFGSS